MSWPSVALGLGGLGILAAPRPSARSTPRLRLSSRKTQRPARKIRARKIRSYFVAALAGIATGALLGLEIGLCVGVVTLFIVARNPAWLTRDQHRRKIQRELDLPGSLDLLAVCLRSGMPMSAAMELLAQEQHSSLARDFKFVASLLALGAGPEIAWTDFRQDEVLGPVASAAIRAGESGSQLAESFDRLASQRRSELSWFAETIVRKIGVWAMVPLGLCFLPAFVCLGILPVVFNVTAAATQGINIS